MSMFRPSAAEERWLAVADVAGEKTVTAADTGGWRTASLLPRCAFFLLGILASAALFGLAITLSNSAIGAGFFTAFICIGVAELLITSKRFFGMGFEEALWLCGAMSLLPVFISHASDRSIAVGIAIAFAATALRLVNPLFATCALAAASWRMSLDGGWQAATIAFAIGTVIAWLALRKNFARPSAQRFAEWMSVVLPLGAYLWAKQFNFEPWRYLDREVTIDSMTSFALPLVLIAAAAIALTLGLRWRQHALLIASVLCVVLLAIEFRDVSGLTIEAKLIVYGIVVLISSVILERRLRRPHGVTSLSLGHDSDAWKIIELGTAATLATSSQHRDSTPGGNELEQGGGSYGGAGSSGSF
jgi:uncharacterized membrane protein YgcG